MAEAKLGFGEKAVEYFRMINPIEHAKTKDAVQKYKVEPYVVPADIYGKGNLAGRGGWTWYTGSSSWLYQAGIESILGLRIEGNKLYIDPNISPMWKEYSIRYRYYSSIYNIKIKNLDEKTNGIRRIKINGKEQNEGVIQLDGNGGNYEIEAEM